MAKWQLWLGVWLLGLATTGCGGPKRGESAANPTDIKIERLEPGSTGITLPFNVRADGQAVLAVFGPNLPADSTVFWNEQQLETTGGGTFVAAVVPSNLYQAPGTASITVRSLVGVRSNALEFRTYDKTGPQPKIVQLYPNATTIGKGFNLQPDGKSAVGVAGEDFLPGVRLVGDGQTLKTVFGNGTGISAIIPDAIISSAGAHRIWAINPDGKASNQMEFLVTSK